MSLATNIQEYQHALIKKYLESNIFRGGVSDIKAAKEALRKATNIGQICNLGRFICIYGGLFGWGSKIKAVSFFTENEFYYKNEHDSQAIIVPYAKIRKVNYDKGDKTGELLYENSKFLVLPKNIIVALKGIEIINTMTCNSRNRLGEYILSQEEKLFGEYSTLGYFPELFKNKFSKTDILHWITLRCKIVDITAERIEIKITVTDKDYDCFYPQEWEKAIETFSTREDILNRIKEELHARLCYEYSLDQIVFTSRFKKSISKAISNGVGVVSSVASNVYDRLETTAYSEAAHVAREKASIVKKTKGTDNDDYSEYMEQYQQYSAIYQARTKIVDDENNDDYLYYED